LLPQAGAFGVVKVGRVLALPTTGERGGAGGVATVTSNGTPVTESSVTFSDGTTTLASTGTATFSSVTLSAGSHTITASYSGTTTFAGSNNSLSFTVSQAVLTVTGLTANNKVYDTTTTATLNTTSATLAGVLNGDNVTLNTTGARGTFASPNVGPGIGVVVSGLTLGGAQASNYTLTQPTPSANITCAPLTITAKPQSAPSGGTVPTLTFNTTGLLGSNTLSGALTVPGVGNAGDNITVPTGNYPIALGTLANSNYAITFNSANLTVTSSQPIGTVTSIQIDDGTLQHSMVRSITLTFANPITSPLSTVLAGLSLTRASDGLSVFLSGTLDSSGTVLTLTFTGTNSTAVGSTIIGGSLPDGRYTLSYGGTPLLTSSQLWRLYGDLQGTASVNSADVTAFNTAYGVNGTRVGMPNYNVYLDYYANVLMNITDKQQFQSRIGMSI
jgi:hypothetical protein